MKRCSSSLKRLSSKKARLTTFFTFFIVAFYFSFIAIVSFDKSLAGLQLLPGLSVAVILGIGTIVMVWIFTLCYTYWANRIYDKAIHRLRKIYKRKGNLSE